MRLVKKLFIITVALCSVSAFSAEGNAAEGNIAIVDFGRAIFGTDVAKARLKQKQGESDYAGLEAKAAEALQEVVDEEGIVLLINAEAVVTAAPSLDITDKLTDRLNKKTK